MIDDRITIAQRITRLRKNANMTQEQLGEKLNLSSNEISNIERAKNNLSYNTLIDLCNLFDICPCELLCGAMHKTVDDNIISLIREMDENDKIVLHQILLKRKEVKDNLKNK